MRYNSLRRERRSASRGALGDRRAIVFLVIDRGRFV
jgi:hypothetical protein